MTNRFSRLSERRSQYLAQLLRKENTSIPYGIKQVKVMTPMRVPYEIVVLLDKIKAPTDKDNMGEFFGKNLQECAQFVGLGDSFQIDYSRRTNKIGVKKEKDIDKKALVLAFGDLLKRSIAKKGYAVESSAKNSYVATPQIKQVSDTKVLPAIDDIAGSFKFKYHSMHTESLHRREHFISELNALIKRKPLQKLGYGILESMITDKGSVICILEHEDDAGYTKNGIEAAMNVVLKYYMSNIDLRGNFSVKYYGCAELKDCGKFEMLDFIRIKHLEKSSEKTIDSLAFLHAFQSTVLEREVSRNISSYASYTSRSPKS